MEKATLEVVVERLDRLEKMIGHINEQLSWIVEDQMFRRPAKLPL